MKFLGRKPLVYSFLTMFISGAAYADWIAFIDHARGPETAAYVTGIDLTSTPGASLTNLLDGRKTAAGFYMTRSGLASGAGAMAKPYAGTPAFNCFEGFVDWTSAYSGNNVVLLYQTAIYTMTFTNLNPAKAYRFRGTSSRGGDYPARWTFCAISGADTFIEAHSSGCLTNGDPRIPVGTLTAGQTAYNSGANLTGEMAGWDNISPGADGQFSVEMRQWRGAIPGGTAGDTYAYALTAMRLEEVEPASNRAYVSYAGGTYSENFDSMGPSGTTTPSGWFVGPANGAQGSVSGTTVTVADGSSATPAVYSLGVAGTYDRALGCQASSTVGGDLNLELRIMNNTGSNITSFTIQFDGEQWRANGVSEAPQFLIMYYSTDGANFIPMPAAFTFSSVVDAGTTALNGNEAANRTAGIGGAYTPDAPIPPNTIFYLRWYDVNNSGSDHQLAIDNVTFTAGAFRSSWTAFNDHTTGSGTGPNVSTYSLRMNGGGPLTNQINGLPLSAALSVRTLGDPLAVQYGAEPDSGTPAYMIFNGYVDFRSSSSTDNGGLLYALSNQTATLTFTNLDPAKRYSFRGTSMRAGVDDGTPANDFRRRWTLCSIAGALSYTETHSTGCVTATTLPISNLGPGQAAYNSGRNNTTGDVVGWDNIIPSPNGTFSIAQSQYWGAIWGGETAYTTLYPGYLINGFRLEEFSKPGATVYLTRPLNNSVIPGPTDVSISAALEGFTKPVTNVQFYSGNTFLGQVASEPYDFTWVNVALGSYVLRAVAVDNAGVRSTSAPVNITLAEILPPGIPLGVTYTFTGVPPVTDWSTISIAGGGATALNPEQFDLLMTDYAASSVNQALGSDTGYNGHSRAYWHSGDQTIYMLPTGNAGSLLMATLVNNMGRNVPVLNLTCTMDRSAIVEEEVNGVRAFYSLTGLPNSWIPIPELTTDATGTLTASVSVGSWPNATQLYILWGDDNGNGFTDAAWIWREFRADPGFVGITNPLNNARITLPTNLLISASVAALGNPVAGVSFYANTTFLGTDTTVPYACTWSNMVPGAFSLRAVVTDTSGLSVTSPPVRITVQNNTAPSISIASPSHGSVFTAPADIPILVNANDSDGAVTNVQFFAGTQKIGESSFSPFDFVWLGRPTGVYDLTAVARDNQGAISTSTVSRVFVIVSTPPVVSSFLPTPGTVSNLTQITVTFAEPVDGVDAPDLLVNGSPATSVTGATDVYTFTFPQPKEGLVSITWAPGAGIRDRENPPKAFEGTDPGSKAQYLLVDTIPPKITAVDPPPGSTLSSLARVEVTFSEPMGGINASDILVNGVPAQSVSGSMAGPYRFVFPQPAAGPIQISWAAAHGIHDLSLRRNALVPGPWNYTLDLSGAETNVIISEIMYHPTPEMPEPVNQEWIELHNRANTAINLQGWQLSRGVNFTFTNTSLPAHGYLVVAADLAAFQAHYPGVNNVVGNWRGQLGNNGDTITLRNASGDTINSVTYASQGDWATRLRGRGERQVTSLTRNGTTMTAFVFGHDMGGDLVTIYGADQPGYNTTNVAISPTSSSTFNYSISGAPAEQPSGIIVCRQISDGGSTRRGWGWSSLADGLGRSMELVNLNMPNQYGQSWAPSTVRDGTPGAPNSVARTDAAPVISDVAHAPLIPRSTNSVTITARVVDEVTHDLGVWVMYRDASTTTPPNWTSVFMYDDGQHGDGLANDNVFGGSIPAQPNGTVIEFYVHASDVFGNSRDWPTPAVEADGFLVRAPNALYQVDESVYTGNQPLYRIIMTESERAELRQIHDQSSGSDATMNATFITIDGAESTLTYCVGVRNRGAGSRSAWPMNYRVGFPNDKRWKGARSVHLNTVSTYSQMAGSSLGEYARTDVETGRAVQVLVNGVNLAYDSLGNTKGSYMQLESTDSDYAANHYPLDSGGNTYRGSKYPWDANLTYVGENPSSYQGQTGRGYYKTSNSSQNDWTDLINLCSVLNNTPDADYVQAVRQVVNVEKWMRNLAFFQLAGSSETGLQIGVGDDYCMYRPELDPRFILLGHDLDTLFSSGTSRSLFTMCPSENSGANAYFFDRFMKHQEFAPIYYRELNDLLNTTFQPGEFGRIIDQSLGDWAADVAPGIKSWANTRYNWVRSQIPLTLTVTHSLPTVNGYLQSTAPMISLSGVANAIETRSVKVNGSTATWTAWRAQWTHNNAPLLPGLNTMVVQALNADGTEIERRTFEVWYERGAETTVPASTLAGTNTWSPINAPYHLTGNVTVGNGATLTIQPGTTVYLDNGASLIIANGGRLLAEGTDLQRIRFTRVPGSSATWGGIVINGAAGSPESRLAYAHFEFFGSPAIRSTSGTIFLDHLTFGTTANQYLLLDNSSFVVQDCVFPSSTSEFNLVQGSGGVKSGGRGVFLRNFFGIPVGYSDVLWFRGGNRPSQPILQVVNNVFAGAVDDHIQLEGADAWIQGNIFLHAHKLNSPDMAGAISGTAFSGSTSEITIMGNIFYDCDHAAIANANSFFTLLNNTIVHQSHAGSQDTDGALVCLNDGTAGAGAGIYLEANIVYDAEKLVRNQGAALVTFTNNLLPLAWAGPGGGNSTADPLLKYVPQLSDAFFTSWAQAQVLRDWFSLRPGSPGAGTGPNAQDKGAVIPLGVSVSGLSGTTPQTSATLKVGLVRTGNGIPTAGWPNGSGYTHYKWRLDGGAWSAETPVNTAISLSGLLNGPHYVDVIGKNDGDLYQNDSTFGTNAVITRSGTWIVQTNVVPVILNEVLARNDTAVPVGSKYPDLIELYNCGAAQVDLSGFSITDGKNDPRKFVFPPGTYLAPGNYLVLYADNDSTPPGIHLGFSLQQEGDDVYLFTPDGDLLDSITFGPQLPDYSIGRLADGQWGLTRPTFGAGNVPVEMGDPHALKINEWLTRGVSPINYDFIELLNMDGRPVSLSGLYLTDNGIGAPRLHEVAPLSFIPGNGYAVYFADGNTDLGPNHLNFKLSADRGMIALYDQTNFLIDYIVYGPQTRDISQGRSPNGTTNLFFFTSPTPGSPNLAPPGPPGGQLVINELLVRNSPSPGAITNIDGGTPSWLELYNPTAASINLAGMSLTEDPTVPRKWVFPSGVTIPSGGHRLVLFDPSVAPSTNAVTLLNTGFGIPDNGGTVYLFDQGVGGGQLDAIVYGVQAMNYSIGRVPNASTNWVLNLPSPNSGNSAAATGNAMNLRVNEWMADPASGDDWFEIYNPNSQPVNLSGLYLTDDITTFEARHKFKIQALSFIGTGLYGYERFWADNAATPGPNHCTFALRAGGEFLGIFTEADVRIDALAFPAQVTGVSQGRLPDGSTNITSFPLSVSPGDANWLPLTNIVINEVLASAPAGWPIEQAIELQNVSASSVNIGGWYLSNQRRHLKKYRIPDNTIVPAGQYKVFYAYQFNFDPRDASCFSLDTVEGDNVYLAAADAVANLTGYRTSVDFGVVDSGISFGRYTNSVLQVDFTPLTNHTFGVSNPELVTQFRTGTGALNARPLIGSVVMSEIMYHPTNFPGGVDNVRDEFIELMNITSNTVPLYDPARRTNTWHLRDGVKFSFPTNVSLAPGGLLLVLSFDPLNDATSLAAFRRSYPQLSPTAMLFGPYSGKLDNGGESVELCKPGVPTNGVVPLLLVDRVKYSDVAPWSPLADGTGMSLQRTNTPAYGNDPANWRAATPTPGPVSSNPDTDGDGIPDSWMVQYFGHPTGQPGDLSMANQDADFDGMTNLQEYQAGTNPRNASSTLEMQAVLGTGGAVDLIFTAVSNKTYSIYYSDVIAPASWIWGTSITAAPTNRLVRVPVPPLENKRFYRVVTP